MLHAGRHSLAIRSFIVERNCIASPSWTSYLCSLSQNSSSPSLPTPTKSFARHASSSAPAPAPAKSKSTTSTPGTPSSTASESFTRKAGQPRATAKKVDYGAKFREQKRVDVIQCLADETASPNRVWARYTELLDVTKDGHIPLNLHQKVLRRCTPSFQAVRSSFARNLPEHSTETRLHPYERRFLTIFNTMKRSGQHPSLNDYEFVLEQFAAVGHHVGCSRVLREIMSKGLGPRTRTHGLCLRAIAYRLSLPHRGTELEIGRLKEECSRFCLFVMNTVQKRAAERRKGVKRKEKEDVNEAVVETGEKRGIPSVCVDFTLRIMKDTDDTEAFLSILKIAYGIDLQYLDRHPLPSEGMLEQPEQLSTAALTTIVDFLGKTSQLSKMVSTFEVLKAPLGRPLPSAVEGSEVGFEDDDDDYVIPMDTLATPLPSAQPNNTTYNALIRRCISLNHGHFAKHYLLEAIDADRISSEKLVSQVRNRFPHVGSEVIALPEAAFEMGLEDIERGLVHVNVDTFRPLAGWANRRKDYELTKWLLMRVRDVVRWKTTEQRFFERLLGMDDGNLALPPPIPPTLFSEEHVDKQSPVDSTTNDGWERAEGLSDPSEFFTPTVPSAPPAPSTPTPSMESITPSSKPASVSKTRPFYPSQHLSLLRSQRKALVDLSKDIGTSLERIADRKKEWLGRRVWGGKNVYVSHMKQRVQLSKQQWVERVHFGGRERERNRNLKAELRLDKGNEGSC